MKFLLHSSGGWIYNVATQETSSYNISIWLLATYVLLIINLTGLNIGTLLFKSLAKLRASFREICWRPCSRDEKLCSYNL